MRRSFHDINTDDEKEWAAPLSDRIAAAPLSCSKERFAAGSRKDGSQNNATSDIEDLYNADWSATATSPR